VKIGRNDPCPCGSGAKVKRCCGVDGVRRSHEALTDLFQLAAYFPRQRPACETFDAWAADAPPDVLTRDLVEEGLFQLGPAERARIPAEFADTYPEIWASLLDDAGDAAAATQMLLVGAVVAGLEERHRELDLLTLAILELDLEAREDPVESLAFALNPDDLWSAIEVENATESLDRGFPVAKVADSLWSEWHEQRLAELVRRVRGRLPVAEFPAASSGIEAACSAFERDRRVRTRLRAETLLDALPPVGDPLRLVA
jgi:SEC-C motif